jgi:hypothetical protein
MLWLMDQRAPWALRSSSAKSPSWAAMMKRRLAPVWAPVHVYTPSRGEKSKPQALPIRALAWLRSPHPLMTALFVCCR